MITVAMASSLAKEVEGTSTASSNRICSNGGSRENECSNGILSTEDKICTMKPICYGSG